MKWLLCAYTTLAIFATSIEAKERRAQACCPPPEPKKCCATPPPPEKEPGPCDFDYDLFRKHVPVVTGEVQFLYWRVLEGGLDYALKMQHQAWGPSPSYAQGKFETGEYNWDPGFRVAVAYFRAPKLWQVKGEYTRLTAHGQNDSGKPEVDKKFITGTWPQIMTDPLAGAQSHLHLNFNTFDLFVNRFFNPNPHLRMRIIGGGSVAWIDQDWKVRYFDSFPHSTTIRNRWKFTGGGFTLGTSADWYWTSDIYISGGGYAGMLVGTYRNRAEQKTTFQPTVEDDTSVKIRDADLRDTRTVFKFQLLLGPSWQKNFSCSRVELFAGYEINSWFNLQEVYRSTSGDPSEAKETWMSTGVVSLQGLTTRLTVDF